MGFVWSHQHLDIRNSIGVGVGTEMNPLSDIMQGLIKPVTELVSEFIVDKDKAQELAHKIAIIAGERAHTEVMGQIGVNAVEAANPSVFVSGWRPAAGWGCVFGLYVNFLVIPLAGPVLKAYTKIEMVPLDLSVMLPLLLGMLGLTAARSIDKNNGVARP